MPTPGTDSDGIHDKAVADAVSMCCLLHRWWISRSRCSFQRPWVALMLTERMLAEAWPPRTGSPLPMVLHRDRWPFKVGQNSGPTDSVGGADAVHPSVLTSADPLGPGATTMLRNHGAAYDRRVEE